MNAKTYAAVKHVGYYSTSQSHMKHSKRLSHKRVRAKARRDLRCG